MDENLESALIMAFSLIVFIIALTLTLYMFSKITYTSEVLIANSDVTRFYENVEMRDTVLYDGPDDDTPDSLYNKVLNGKVRIVDSSTLIPTLYRYYKENFCVKIYDETTGANSLTKTEGTTGPRLVQVFDMTLEGQVNKAVTDTNANESDIARKMSDMNTDLNELSTNIRNFKIKEAYNKKPSPFGDWVNYWDDYDIYERLYMFGAPWVGSTENTKKRIDYFINGGEGYINNQYVNYVGNPFARSIKENNGVGGVKNEHPKYAYTEQVVSYSYTGDTVETDDGEILVEGAASKDKVVIIYTIIDNIEGTIYDENKLLLETSSVN